MYLLKYQYFFSDPTVPPTAFVPKFLSLLSFLPKFFLSLLFSALSFLFGIFCLKHETETRKFLGFSVDSAWVDSVGFLKIFWGFAVDSVWVDSVGLAIWVDSAWACRSGLIRFGLADLGLRWWLADLGLRWWLADLGLRWLG